jgi:hypothetical protein
MFLGGCTGNISPLRFLEVIEKNKGIKRPDGD